MEDYLKSFIIGSSLPVFITFFLSVAKINNNIKNYSYKSYTIISPLYFGIVNMLSLYYLKNYDRFIFTGLISPLIVIIFAKSFNSYNFSFNEWLYYSLKIIIKHFIIWNLVIRYLEKKL